MSLIKPVRYKPSSKLDFLDAPRGLFTDFTMDIITYIPLCKYHPVIYDSIFPIIDRYTKMTRYIATRIDCTTKRLSKAFLEHV